MISKIKVDRNTGWILEAQMNQKIKGDAYIKGNSKIPNGMKVPMTMTNYIIITN